MGYHMQVDASQEECVAVWQGLFKKTTYVTCHVCKTYRYKALKPLKYHWNRCGKVLMGGGDLYKPWLCGKILMTKVICIIMCIGTCRQGERLRAMN